MTTVYDQINRTPVSYILVIGYVAMACVTILGVAPDEQTAKLVHYGALLPILVAEGEPWRLLTHTLLHGGLLHLIMNSAALVMLGPSLEERVGSLRFLLIYTVGTLGGAMGAVLWHHPLSPVVGGSGALFGLIGAGIALHMRQGRHLLEFLNYGGPRFLLTWTAAMLVIGALIPRVSNAAHIGGLIYGFALVFCFLERGRDPIDRTSRVIRAGWLALWGSLLLYAIVPVVRIDYLYERCLESPSSAERLEAYDLRSRGG